MFSRCSRVILFSPESNLQSFQAAVDDLLNKIRFLSSHSFASHSFASPSCSCKERDIEQSLGDSRLRFKRKRKSVHSSLFLILNLYQPLLKEREKQEISSLSEARIDSLVTQHGKCFLRNIRQILLHERWSIHKRYETIGDPYYITGEREESDHDFLQKIMMCL
jgi:hypothetical protein